MLKFDKDGRFIKSWGGKGKEPGQFDVAHGIAIDAKGLLWVMDRENQRIQVFDADGTFVREQKYKGLPCSVAFGRDEVFMVNGFAGQLLRLDLAARSSRRRASRAPRPASSARRTSSPSARAAMSTSLTRSMAC